MPFCAAGRSINRNSLVTSVTASLESNDQFHARLIAHVGPSLSLVRLNAQINCLLQKLFFLLLHALNPDRQILNAKVLLCLYYINFNLGYLEQHFFFSIFGLMVSFRLLTKVQRRIQSKINTDFYEFLEYFFWVGLIGLRTLASSEFGLF